MQALEALSSKSSIALLVTKTWLNSRNGEGQDSLLHKACSRSTFSKVKLHIACHKNMIKLPCCTMQALEALSSKSSIAWLDTKTWLNCRSDEGQYSFLHHSCFGSAFFKVKLRITRRKTLVKLQKRWGSLCRLARSRFLRHVLQSQASHIVSQKHG